MTPWHRSPIALAFVACLVASLVLAGCTGPVDAPDRDPAQTRALPSAAPLSTTLPADHRVLGLKWNWSQEATLEYAAGYGGGWTFAEVEWCDVEPVPGQRDWTRIDGIVGRSDQLGHEVMLKIRTGQCWATQTPAPGVPDRTETVRKTPSTPPVDDDAYRSFVTELVTRYAAAGVHTYAIENEPDVYNFWASTIEEYENLVRIAAPTIRAADPEARVLEAGLSSTGYGVVLARRLAASGEVEAALAAYQSYYARRIEGGASRWPGVGDDSELSRLLTSAPATRATEVYDAAVRLVVEGVVDAYQLHFYEPTSELSAVLGLVREGVGDAAIEAWEVGVAWPGDSYDAFEASAETTRLVALLLAGGVTRIVYLPLAYTPAPVPQVFRGLVEESGAVLPSGEAFRLLAGHLVTGPDRRLHPVDPGSGLTGVVLDRGGEGQVAILWAVADAVELRTEGGEVATDHLGDPVPSPLTVGAAPVMVTSASSTLDRYVAR